VTRLAIDIDHCREVLQRLLAIPSPTGYTDTIVRPVVAELEALGAAVEITRRGGIRGRLAGAESKPARAIISHLDTLGAQVRALKDNGRLAVAPIGTWSARFAEGVRCTIFSERGAYRGTILPLLASGHTFHEKVDSQPVGWDHVEIRVDGFARGRQELARLGIDIGDIVAIDPGTELLDNGFIVSRHLDNKAGVAVMLAALKALRESGETPPVDIYWLFSIAEEVGVGASALLTPEIAAMVTVDNGTTAPGQNSSEFGVTIAMADQTGPFDFHLTRKLVQLCRDHDIRFQKDVFRHYRSDSASAIEAGHDVRTALITFGVDASHGYERIHMHALRSLAELVTAYATSPVEIRRDAEEVAKLEGFTTQPMEEAKQALKAESELEPGGKG
jgi:peptidase M42 family hydrolase